MGTDTRAAILSVIAWDLQQLRAGVWPTTDHTGAEFPEGSFRANRDGQRMGRFTATFVSQKGDLEAAMPAHSLQTRHYRCSWICDWCWACGTNSHLSCGDFSTNAQWRSTDWRTVPCGFKCLAFLGPADCGTAPWATLGRRFFCLWVVLKGNHEENHYFGGPLKKTPIWTPGLLACVCVCVLVLRFDVG